MWMVIIIIFDFILLQITQGYGNFPMHKRYHNLSITVNEFLSSYSIVNLGGNLTKGIISGFDMHYPYTEHLQRLYNKGLSSFQHTKVLFVYLLQQ